MKAHTFTSFHLPRWKITAHSTARMLSLIATDANTPTGPSPNGRAKTYASGTSNA